MGILIGFFVGLLCGILPLVFGVVLKNMLMGTIGIVSSALSGMVFALLGKSPFTAIGIALVFIIAIFANHKRKNMRENGSDNNEFSDDE
jgi:uncharacterized membrane protein